MLGQFNYNLQLILIMTISIAIVMYSFFTLIKIVKDKYKSMILGITYNLLSFMMLSIKDPSFTLLIKHSTVNSIILITTIIFGPITSLIGILFFVIYFIYVKLPILMFINFIIMFLVGILIRFLIKKIKYKYLVLLVFVITFVTSIISFSLISFVTNNYTYAINCYLAHLLTLPLFTSIVILVIDNKNRQLIKAAQAQKDFGVLLDSMNATKSIQIIILDKDYRYIEFNNTHKQTIKKIYNLDIYKGQYYLDILPNLDVRENFKKALDKAYLGMNYEMIHISSANQTLKTYFSGIKEENGNVKAVVFFTQDITEERSRQKEIYNLTYIDSLTNVYNRHYFTENFDSYEDIDKLFLLYLDVNMLKFINDAFGHQQGDELLKHVATVAKEVFTQDTDIIRMGGDEFVIVFKDQRKEKIDYYLNEFINEIKTSKKFIVPISISYGLAVRQKGHSFESVLKSAEEKMYKDKLFSYERRRNNLVEHIYNYLLKEEIIDEKLIALKYDYMLKLNNFLNFELDKDNILKLVKYCHIGKISISVDNLKKVNKTEKEQEELEHYIDVGYRILSSIPQYREIAKYIIFIEERYDGLGYPNKIKGDTIPLVSQAIHLLNHLGKTLFAEKESINSLANLSNKLVSEELIEKFKRMLENEKN